MPEDLDAGPYLHPMTLIDLFYFVLEHHADLIEAWDRSQHEVWCACGGAPQAYARPDSLRPVLAEVPPCERPCCLGDGEPEPLVDPRQLALALDWPDVEF